MIRRFIRQPITFNRVLLNRQSIRCMSTSKESHNHRHHRKQTIKLGLVYGVAAFITFQLGLWQMRRRIWKQQKIDDRKDLVYSNAKEHQLGDDIRYYQPLWMEGEFLTEYTLFVGPRKSPIEARTGINIDAEYGWYVFCPFRLNDGSIIMVNRGWSEEKIPIRKSTGERVRIHVLRTEHEEPRHIRRNEYAGNQVDEYNFMNAKVMYHDLGFTEASLPTGADEAILVAVLNPNDDSFGYENRSTSTKRYSGVDTSTMLLTIPDDHINFYTTPEKHVAYAITWFALSFWIVMSAAVLYRRSARLAFKKNKKK